MDVTGHVTGHATGHVTGHVSYPLKKAPDQAEMSGNPLKSVIG